MSFRSSPLPRPTRRRSPAETPGASKSASGATSGSSFDTTCRRGQPFGATDQICRRIKASAPAPRRGSESAFDLTRSRSPMPCSIPTAQCECACRDSTGAHSRSGEGAAPGSARALQLARRPAQAAAPISTARCQSSPAGRARSAVGPSGISEVSPARLRRKRSYSSETSDPAVRA